jgi:translation initiation factor 1
MSKIDWKDNLGALFAEDLANLKPEETAISTEKAPIAKQHFRIELDKKGRNGKQATLITGFEGSDDDLKELARSIKTTCGVGGSTRDGEILIQGDFRKKIADLLTEQGHKVKRINF